MNKTDKQVCALRELVMAKQAYDRSRRELLAALELRDDCDAAASVDDWVSEEAANGDPRSIDAEDIDYLQSQIDELEN